MIDKKVLTFDQIFESKLPPTGTGDCCAPKLLNHAFANNLTPLSLCEAFYGKNDIRHKKIFSPCLDKCKTLLKAMLNLDIIYADKHICVVNKDPNIVTIPGKTKELQDCVSSRVKKIFKFCIDQPSVHRLDMDTSGLLVFGLTKESHRLLSIDFQNKKVKKTYLALVRGIVKEKEGIINLPHRLDVNNRPYQLVDFENGKESITKFKRLNVEKRNNENVTRLLLTPITGRTHQLRVHCKNSLFEIVGDRLYGTRYENENRMMLQALSLEFTHPYYKIPCSFQLEMDF